MGMNKWDVQDKLLKRRTFSHFDDFMAYASGAGFVFSKFFREHNKDIYKRTAEELEARGCRFAAPRSHAKVICIHWRQGGHKLALEGSANLRTNSNQEQLAIFNCPELHDWHCAWIEAELDKHESE